MTETNLFLLANGKLDVYNKFGGLKHLGSLNTDKKFEFEADYKTTFIK